MELSWLQNRLSVMSPQEVIFRIGRLVSSRYQLLRYRLHIDTSFVPALNNAEIGFYELGSFDKDSFANSAQMNSTLAHEEKAIQLFHNQPKILHESSVNWSQDPKTGGIAPSDFGKLIDYRNDELVGDIKYLWELGRHQYLVPLAIDVVASGDQASADKLSMYLQTWLDQNPIHEGIHWCSSLEVALRLIAWSFVHSILLVGGIQRGIFSLVSEPQSLEKSIFYQVKFIQAYYSRHSSANNHLFGELVGVWVACNVFEFAEQTDTWRKHAQSELEREANLQNYSDGVNREQAIYYHLWVQEYMLLAWLVGRRFERPFSDNFESVLARMSGFLNNICSTSLSPPNIGDADGGQVARFTHDISDNPYKDLLQAFEASIGKCKHNSSPYSKSYWYSHIVSEQVQSEKVKSNLIDLSEKKVLPINYPESGYCLLGDDRLKVCFKAGQLGYLSTAAHGHADLLSFCLSVDDAWWLTDQGTYSYHSDPEWRDYFRGTSAHNTVQVNSLNQSKIGGAFLWLEKASAQTSDFNAGPSQSVTGRMNIFQGSNVKHARILDYRVDGKTLCIQDVLDIGLDPLPVIIEIRFHFHPTVQLNKITDSFYKATMDGRDEKLELNLSKEMSWQLLKGQTTPKIEGWYSEGYDQKVPSCVLIGTKSITNSTTFYNSIELA